MTARLPSAGPLSTSAAAAIGGRPEPAAGRLRLLAAVGDPAGRLLAGAPGPEDLVAHYRRLGPLPDLRRPDELVEAIDRSGLGGRGGGYFPLIRKVRLARSSPGRPLIVVNATEGEPAVAKDRTLLRNRPHLLLDGAQVLAAAAGAERVFVAVHRGRPETADLLRAVAAREEEATRPAGGPGRRSADPVPVEVVAVPDRYIAGESSAVVSWIDGGPARPAGRIRPTAECGIAGRPTVVSNAETVAHLALLARRGPDWFHRATGPGGPGTALITVTGDVGRPGSVLEVAGAVTVGDVLAAGGGADPRAVLIGGYTGSWADGDLATDLTLQPGPLAALDAGIGCGLVAALGSHRCPLVETAHLVRWLSGQRAGQCGTCDTGMPALAELVDGVAAGRRAGRRSLAHIVGLGQTIAGRGLCGLPDGTVAMVESALRAFPAETRLHRRHRCTGRVDDPLLPLPGDRP